METYHVSVGRDRSRTSSTQDFKVQHDYDKARTVVAGPNFGQMIRVEQEHLIFSEHDALAAVAEAIREMAYEEGK